LASQEALQADVLIQVWPVDAFAPLNEAVVSALGHGRKLEAGVEPDGDGQRLSVLKVDAHEVCLEGDAADSQVTRASIFRNSAAPKPPEEASSTGSTQNLAALSSRSAWTWMGSVPSLE
jgi:hypothetical protein